MIHGQRPIVSCLMRCKRSMIPGWLNVKQILFLELKKMYCSLCRSYPTIADTSSSFYTGSQVFRRDNLQGHHISNLHTQVKSTENWKWKQLLPVKVKKDAVGELDKQIGRMALEDKMKMGKIFTAIYFINMHEKTFTLYPQILALQEWAEIGDTLCIPAFKTLTRVSTTRRRR